MKILIFPIVVIEGYCYFSLTRLSGILIVIQLNLLFLEMKIKSICQFVDGFVEQMLLRLGAISYHPIDQRQQSIP